MTDYLSWYDQLRERGRVTWREPTKTWYVGRFDDVWKLLADPRLGAKSNDIYLTAMSTAQRKACAPVLDFMARWPVFTDMPQHGRLHRLIMPCFRPSEVNRITEGLTRYLMASDVGSVETPDLLDDVLRPACREGLAAFLGLNSADLDLVPIWAERIIAIAGQGAEDDDVVTRASTALEQFREFAMNACRTGESLLSAAMLEAVSSGVLDWDDVIAVYGQLVTGFLEPTLTALSYATEMLLESSDGVAAFTSDPGTFIAESLRLASPFHFAPRRTLEDIAIGDQVVPAKARLVLLLVAANRDPRRFPEPHRFQMDRGAPPHVSFGRGRYACVGAGLAREVIQTVLLALRASADTRGGPLRLAWDVGPGARMLTGVASTTAREPPLSDV
jgi:cytochrome P450